MSKNKKYHSGPTYRFHSKVKGFAKKFATRNARRAGKVRV